MLYKYFFVVISAQVTLNFCPENHDILCTASANTPMRHLQRTVYFGGYNENKIYNI